MKSWRAPSESRPGSNIRSPSATTGRGAAHAPHYTYRRAECKHILKVKEGLSEPRAGHVVHLMVREGVVEDREYQRRLVERSSILAGALESKG